MRSVLILEPNHGGHNATYLRWIVEGFVDNGIDVRVTTLKDSFKNDRHMQSLAEDLGTRIDLAVLDRQIDPALRQSDLNIRQVARREAQYYRLFAELYLSTRRAALEPVFVPYLDYMAYAMALTGSPFEASPWGGIVMRPAFHFRDMGVKAPRVGWSNVKRRLFTRLLRAPQLEMLFSIDPTLVKFYEARQPKIASHKIRFLPEPGEVRGTETRDQARAQLGIPTDARVVLVYGELRARKGVDALVEASALPEFPARAHLLLAGTQHPEVQELLRSPLARELANKGRLHTDNRVLAGEDEHRVFAAADVVWLGYRGHYAMSAVLIQAGKMNLPVIACREGLLGNLTREGDLGLLVDPSDRSAVARSVSTLCKDDEKARCHGDNGAAFFANRNTETFMSTICNDFQPSRETAVA
jgi:glycosyltransferase involved in cell wall biosynthesis